MPSGLTHRRDLEWFDGPFLSEWTNPRGEPYIYYWCDRDERFDRWIVVRVSRPDLLAYEIGKIDLLTLLYERCIGGFAYIHDQPLKSVHRSRVQLAEIVAVPAEYRPESGLLTPPPPTGNRMQHRVRVADTKPRHYELVVRVLVGPSSAPDEEVEKSLSDALGRTTMVATVEGCPFYVTRVVSVKRLDKD